MTQKALGTAVAEALPEAERVLAAVQQVGTDAALHLTSPAAPAALVSSAALRALRGVGLGRAWQLGDQRGPGRGRC